MKTLLLSDIHSNIYALEAIWKKEGGADRILCAGDLVDYGPYPREVIAWARDHSITCVQGNHDGWLVQVYRDGKTLEKVPRWLRAWVHHNAALVDEADIQFLAALPRSLTFELDGLPYAMKHFYDGYQEIVSLYAYRQFIGETFGAPLAAQNPRLILGHTHRQSVRFLADDICWINPGSVSYRRSDDPDQTAHYATITDGKVSLQRLEYDITPLRRAVDSVRLKRSEMKIAQRMFAPRE